MLRRLIILLLIVGCEGVYTPEDCAGVAGGDAVEDCFGVCSGAAAIDSCGVCTGGCAFRKPYPLQNLHQNIEFTKFLRSQNAYNLPK